jgi:hypothetical protein
MSNLRSLLNKETITSLSSGGAAIQGIDDGKQFIFHPQCNLDCCFTNYSEYCLRFFCVPCGTTQMTFEIWGGGGSGAGACCCQQGIPGGSGAYARKTLNYPEIQGGWCYCLVVGPPTCCSACCCGIQGCKSFVLGCNLTNFCADGGLPGKTCCYAYWGSSFNCIGKVYFSGCGGWNPSSDCSCGFGADCVIPGRPGYFENYCNCDNCWTKLGLPYPGKLINDLGGHMVTSNDGNACLNNHAYCTGSTPWAFNPNCNTTLPGTGAPSATSCSGSCCYGTRGVGGLVKITYCSCWLGVNGDCSYHFYN